jgi:ribosomal-protein-alanine N-acetyltransferase
MMHSSRRKVAKPSAVSVRQMSESDISAARSILEESPEAVIWSRESLLDSLSHGIALVAELDEHVSGFLIGRIAADEFEILNLAVGKQARRRGIATQLVSSAIESGRSASARKTYLEVRASNNGGIAFYEMVGFRVCGRRPNYYRAPVEDAVLLVYTNLE